MEIKEVPVFEPTFEEFKNFKTYLESIYDDFKKCGLARIIPPKEWNPFHNDKIIENYSNQKYYEENTHLNDIEVCSPITQFIDGIKGVYHLTLIEEQNRSVSDFQKLCTEQEESCLSDEEIKSETKENYDNLEMKFWRTLQIDQNPSMYGADMAGNLFDEKNPWNMKHLDSVLQLLKENPDTNDLPGITDPYLYFGMWKSMFAWHSEDLNLCSINYLHFGKPKRWYCIPPEYSQKFENYARFLYPGDAKECPEFLRHKLSMIHPNYILNQGIPVYTTIHRAGEFMITFPYSYHAGFNYGFNCAESVNFAHENWFEYGKLAQSCQCRGDTARMDVEGLEYCHNVKKLGARSYLCDDPECNQEFCIFPRKRKLEDSPLPPKKQLRKELQNYRVKIKLKILSTKEEIENGFKIRYSVIQE
eukprot:gene7386-11708_t